MNYLDFPKYIVKCCQGCIFKQLLQNNTLRTELSFYLFYCLSIIKMLPAKPPDCSSFSFMKVRVMPTFQTMRYAFPGCPWVLVHCFSVVEHLKSWLGKLASKSVDGCYAWLSIGKETHLRDRAYLCVSLI